MDIMKVPSRLEIERCFIHETDKFVSINCASLASTFNVPGDKGPHHFEFLHILEILDKKGISYAGFITGFPSIIIGVKKDTWLNAN